MISRHPQGFTLVEVLLSVAISAGVALMVFQGLQLLEGVGARAAARNGVDAEAAFLVARLQEVLRAGTAVAPGPGQSSGTLETADGTTVTLAGDRAVIGGAVPETELTSAHVSVTALEFRNLAVSGSPDIVTVLFTLAASPSIPSLGASYSHDFTSTIGIR